MLTAAILFAAGALAAAPPARSDLPPPEKVREVLDAHPVVAAARARVAAAQAQGAMLSRGAHEVQLSGSYIHRSVDREGGFDEFDGTLSRAIRLPGKAALDRRAGMLGIDVAENRMADARHQLALELAGLWHDWQLAGTQYRADRQAIAALEDSVRSVRRQVELRDAATLDLDRAQSQLAAARARGAAALARQASARAMLAARFPLLPLPLDPPEAPPPALPPAGLQPLRDRVLSDSHEIRAADREAERLGVVARRIEADRTADPTLGVRLFSERGGAEKGAGVVAAIPFGGGYRRSAAEQARAEENAARLELAGIQQSVRATADADMAAAELNFAAWRDAQTALTAAIAARAKAQRAYTAGEIDLAELLLAQGQAAEALRNEGEMRVEADRAMVKLEIDSHSLWINDGD
jgi:outer membrane protein TolC